MAENVAASETVYSKFREDGWPLCPGCGEDELWSPALPATIETIAFCYRCHWKPLPSEPKAAADPRASASASTKDQDPSPRTGLGDG